MIGEWMKFGPLRPQHLKDKGRRRQRRPGQQDDILELLALSAGWVLIVLGVLHVAGLAYLPLGTR
jgi:Flp pilus assembly protein TadB